MVTIYGYFYWTVYAIFRLILWPVAFVFFPIAYPFRKQAYRYVKYNKKNWWHPLFIANLFFTKDDDNGDYYVGPYWYKKEIKKKYFNNFVLDSQDSIIYDSEGHPIMSAKLTFKQKLIYFYLALRWCVTRNYLWNLHRMLTKEGAITFFITNSNCDLEPQIKYVDKSGAYRDNSGPHVLFYTMDSPYAMQASTVEGYQAYLVYTKRGNVRPGFNFAKVFNVFNKHLTVQVNVGWSIDLGWWQANFRIGLKKKL